MAKLKVMKVSSKNPAYAKVKISNGIVGAKLGWTWLSEVMPVDSEVDVHDSIYHGAKVIPVTLADGNTAKTLEW